MTLSGTLLGPYLPPNPENGGFSAPKKSCVQGPHDEPCPEGKTREVEACGGPSL